MITKKVGNKINLGIVTTAAFPNGLAATNRITSWAQVLSKNDVSVKVYIIKPTEKVNEIHNKYAKGIYQAIEYEYVNNSTIWPIHSSKFLKLWIIIVGYFKMIVKLSNDRPSTVITYTSNFFIRILLLFFQVFLKYHLIIEETEYPKILKKKQNKFFKQLYINTYGYANGMMVMTKELSDYYFNIGVKNVFLLPMSVDANRFSNIKKNNEKTKYFAYCGGNGGFERDGILDIMKGFKVFSHENPQYKMLIIGPINKLSTSYIILDNYIKKNNLTKKVEFTGTKPSNEIPELLVNATGIVMAPPKDFESGGFPTKLGEFLASGTPVICTSVSEIPLYLNETNSFLVAPKDVEGITRAMEFIVNNPIICRDVGEEGKKLANTVFNAETYLSDLLKFLKLNNVNFTKK